MAINRDAAAYWVIPRIEPSLMGDRYTSTSRAPHTVNRAPSFPVIVSARTAPGVSPAIATGIKCSVRPCVALSISTCRVAPISDASRLCNAASPGRAQSLGAFLDLLARYLRHPRRRRARPRRIGKHMQEGQIALFHQILRAREHVLGLGRKARDDIGAERDVRPQPPHLRAEIDRIGAGMPPLHPLQNQIVAGLQRQMQMRHQAFIVRDHVEQIAVDLDLIDR